MQAPRNIKEVQKLNGRLTALGRFLSKAGERSLPFFQILKKNKAFMWTEECQRAFEEFKLYLMKPPLLSKPLDGEMLYIYLAVSALALSAVLIREDEERAQKPVYYVSKVLHGAELRYSRMEKLALALLMASRKLSPYFQAHPITVLTDQPLKKALECPKASG